MSREWLESLVPTDEFTKEARPNLCGIWRYNDYLCATDGNMLGAIPDDGRSDDGLVAGPTTPARVGALLDVPLPQPVPMDLAMLQDWCGPIRENCPECGSGPRCECGHLLVCRYCHDDDPACGACHDTGTIQLGAHSIRAGRFQGVLIDRRRLGHLIDKASGTSVVMSRQKDTEAILFRGEGWRALLMPLRPDYETASDIPTLP